MKARYALATQLTIFPSHGSPGMAGRDFQQPAPTVALVTLLKILNFGAGFTCVLAIASVSSFADSVDFLADISVNLLVLIGLAWLAEQSGIPAWRSSFHSTPERIDASKAHTNFCIAVR